jgi:hypothetical protein
MSAALRAEEDETMAIDDDVNERLARAAPVETLPREDLVRECRRLRERVASLESDMRDIQMLAHDERIQAIRVVVRGALGL